MAHKPERDNAGDTGKRKPWGKVKLVISVAGSVYMTRWGVRSPFCGIYLHRFERGDADPYVHDHPWSFVSFVLRGGYTEVVRDNFTHELRERHVKRINVKRRDDAHYVVKLDRTPTWTLVFVGRRRRTWGFWVPMNNYYNSPVARSEWIEFEDFNANGLGDF